MDSSLSVGAGYVGGLFEVAARAGVGREVLLQRAGLGELHGAHPQARLPMADVIALLSAIVCARR